MGGNYQWGQFVLGVEGDGAYDTLSVTPAALGGGITVTSDWLATVRGRAGYAWDRILIYGTGGAAFANAAATGFSSTTMTGWTAGGGIEAALTPSLSAKVEYLYVDFPNPTLAGATGTFTENIVRAGINYKFW